MAPKTVAPNHTSSQCTPLSSRRPPHGSPPRPSGHIYTGFPPRSRPKAAALYSSSLCSHPISLMLKHFCSADPLQNSCWFYMERRCLCLPPQPWRDRLGKDSISQSERPPELCTSAGRICPLGYYWPWTPQICLEWRSSRKKAIAEGQ